MTTETIQGLMERVKSAPEVTVTRDRYGYRIDGTFYRRVTTYLQGIPKPWLGTWAAKCVAEYAVDHIDAWKILPSRTDQVKLLKGSPWSKRDDAGDRGTAVHNALEAYARKEPMPEGLTEDEAACANAAVEFLRVRGSRILAAELTVFNPTLGYAGTLDLWEIDKNGTSWILDYKTSGSVYAEHAVQQAAYRNAEFAVVQKRQVNGDEKWVGKVIPWGKEMAEMLGIVHVEPDGAKLYPIRYSDRLWTVFRAAVHVKQWLSDVDSFAGKTPREVIYDDPITPTPEEAEDLARSAAP